jgi:hypothetical protein
MIPPRSHDEQPPPCVVAAAEEIIGALCDRAYDAIVRRTKGRRLTADAIAEAIEQYGRTLVRHDVVELLRLRSVISVQHAEPPRWSVVVPLWTSEEGRSDLSVELWVTEHPTGEIQIELDDIHVR